AVDGERALFMVTGYSEEALIMVLGLPKIVGIDVIKYARMNQITVPFLIFTARVFWEQMCWA
ncbi:DNA-binding response regulator, partial [Alteromonas sp. LMIT007]|nr:DNA-binding response regulator [Opacimonas viscosa]